MMGIKLIEGIWIQLISTIHQEGCEGQ
jgi:hypothetical protein